jgi:hypothetical protein
LARFGAIEHNEHFAFAFQTARDQTSEAAARRLVAQCHAQHVLAALTSISEAAQAIAAKELLSIISTNKSAKDAPGASTL